jgi:CxxC motif-containing protein (DUF1111 family)
MPLAARNAPPLFGAGLINALPDAAFEAAVQQQDFQIRGRVHRLKDGRIGRFGWKAQVATLQDFVLTACANELGLEVPGHHQAPSPLDRDAQARGLDLTQAECDALVAYVGSLPSPAVIEPSGSPETLAVAGGRELFRSIGCAKCHIPDLGTIRGIYSDLLIHDMGEKLSDPGQYYDSDGLVSASAPKSAEWRTPPLWGLRDSGPYMHDGRAKTLEEAVLWHGGQGAASVRQFRALTRPAQLRLEAFLKTLVAPASAGSPEASLAVEEDARAVPQERRDEAVSRAANELHIAQALERMGKVRGALDFYRQIVREAPNSPLSRTAAGRIAFLEGAGAADPPTRPR